MKLTKTKDSCPFNLWLTESTYVESKDAEVNCILFQVLEYTKKYLWDTHETGDNSYLGKQV